MTYFEGAGSTTWYDEQGAGDAIILLHGGLSTNALWSAQLPDLAEHFRVIAPERRGHGHTPDVEGPLSYGGMADDTLAFLEAYVGGPAHLVGWSDGAIVALLVALARPDLVRKLVLIGANYDVSGLEASVLQAFATLEPDAEDLAEFQSAYAKTSPDGEGHWPVAVAKFKEMVASEPHIEVAELNSITAPTLVLVGDDDFVSLDHTVSLFRAIDTAELAVIPGASHFVFMEQPELVNRLVINFLQRVPTPTSMPVRRAAVSG